MIKRKALALLLFIFLFSVPALTSEIRLMGMGDMQGIIDDDTDYDRDVTFIPSIINSHVFSDITSNNFVQAFPGNNSVSTPGLLRDFNRSGSGLTANTDILMKLDKNIGVNIKYSEQDRTYMTRYYDAGVPYSIKRNGDTQQSLVSYGSAPTNWFAYGAGYENYSVSDAYTGTETGFPATTCQEDGGMDSVFFGTRFGDNSHYVSFGSGLGNGMMTSKTASVELMSKNVNSPSRGHAIFCYRTNDNLITFKGGGYSEVTPFESYVKGLLGMQIKVAKGLLLGVATVQQYFGDYIIYSRNIGIEHKFNDLVTWRAGIIDKNITYSASPMDRRFFSDYTLGLELNIFPNLSFEGVYRSYEDIYGAYDTWSAMPNFIQTNDKTYNYYDTDKRSDLFMCGLKYTF
jgi:hypothetical protein